MTGRDLFGALVRVLGLYFLLVGVGALVTVIPVTMASEAGLWPLFVATWQITAGVILFCGARGLAQAAYGDKTGDEN